MHCCLIDASKAFDTVDHTLLFEKLMKKNMPTSIIRFLITWYSTQQLTVCWNGAVSRPFGTLDSVCQGDVLSPLLFPYTWMIYWLTCLVLELVATTLGMFVGALAYAHDLTLLAPCTMPNATTV